MKDQNINSGRIYISDELSPIYPKGELSSLVKIILEDVTGLSSAQLHADPERPVSELQWDKFSKIVAQLKENKPIQYILGKTEFYGLQLKVNKHVLIPRQETEELVALILRENRRSGLRIIDIGTGSGAIAIALCRSLAEADITATDISGEALDLAAENSRLNNCRISFIRDDILDSSVTAEASFDLLVSNPPYIRESEKEAMHSNVLDFEPASALFVPDSDPLVFYRAIGQKALLLLKRGASLYLEINEALGKETRDLLLGLGLSKIRIIKDINNKNRIISATRP